MSVAAVGPQTLTAELALHLGVLVLTLGTLHALREVLALHLVQFLEVAARGFEFVCLVDEERFPVRLVHIMLLAVHLIEFALQWVGAWVAIAEL